MRIKSDDTKVIEGQERLDCEPQLESGIYYYLSQLDESTLKSIARMGILRKQIDTLSNRIND